MTQCKKPGLLFREGVDYLSNCVLSDNGGKHTWVFACGAKENGRYAQTARYIVDVPSNRWKEEKRDRKIAPFTALGECHTIHIRNPSTGYEHTHAF